LMRAEVEPWRDLPSAVASVIEPQLEAVTEEILASIPEEVPQYARPFEGSFGRGIRTGVSEALSQFVALVRDPESGRAQGRDVARLPSSWFAGRLPMRLQPKRTRVRPAGRGRVKPPPWPVPRRTSADCGHGCRSTPW